MGKFNRDNRFGGDRGDGFKKREFGGGQRRFGGDRSFSGGFSKPQMYDATCSQCGRPCQVPFRPTGDREVFCNDCFRNKKQGGFGKGGDKFGKPNFEKRSDNNSDHEYLKQQIVVMNKKLDTLILRLEKLSAPAAEPSSEPKEVKEKVKPAKAKAVKKAVTKKKK